MPALWHFHSGDRRSKDVPMDVYEIAHGSRAEAERTAKSENVQRFSGSLCLLFRFSLPGQHFFDHHLITFLIHSDTFRFWRSGLFSNYVDCTIIITRMQCGSAALIESRLLCIRSNPVKITGRMRQFEMRQRLEHRHGIHTSIFLSARRHHTGK